MTDDSVTYVQLGTDLDECGEKSNDQHNFAPPAGLFLGVFVCMYVSMPRIDNSRRNKLIIPKFLCGQEVPFYMYFQ